eukprot:symbB.v1.2.038544.t1/scaffold6031.1/size21590/1
MDVRNVARPSKWNLAKLALVGPASDEDGNLTEVQKILKQVKGGYTTVSQKEDVLETIMNASAHASFECLGRFEMDPANWTQRQAYEKSCILSENKIALKMNRFICWTFPVALAVLPSQHHLLDYDVDLEVDPSNRYAKVWEDFLQQRGSKAFEQTYEAWHAGLRMILPDLFGANATSNQQRWYQHGGVHLSVAEHRAEGPHGCSWIGYSTLGMYKLLIVTARLSLAWTILRL